MPTGERWLSTNHLMGKSCGVHQLIPLGSGSTSVGIVAGCAICILQAP